MHSTGSTQDVGRNAVSIISMFFRSKSVLQMNSMVSSEKGPCQRALPPVRWPKIVDGANAACETWHNPQTPVSSHEPEAATHTLMGTPMVSSAVEILCVSAHTSAGTNPAIQGLRILAPRADTIMPPTPVSSHKSELTLHSFRDLLGRISDSSVISRVRHS